MFPIELNYRITLRDYRYAIYFAAGQQNLFNCRILAVSVAVTLVYYFIASLGLVTFFTPILFIPAAYIIWALWKMIRIESGIRKYLKSKENMLGKEIRASFGDNMLEIAIPELEADNRFVLSKLAAVIELTELYMIYLDGTQTYLVPKRTLSAEDTVLLNKTFEKRLKERFVSYCVKGTKRSRFGRR